MEAAQRPTRTRALAVFLVAAFGTSWGLWALAGATDGTVAEVARIAGSFGPTVAALLVARRRGHGAARSLLRRLTAVGGAGWLVVLALLVPVVLAVAAVGIDGLLGGPVVVELPPVWVLGLVLGYVLVLGGPLGEELGWRGWLLPRLEARMGALGATLAVGGVWALWHAPLFLLEGTVQQVVPAWAFVAQIMITSVVYTWLVHRAPHSLVPALAFHTSFNVVTGLVLLQPSDAPRVRPLAIALVLALLLAVALARTGTFRDVPAASRASATPSARGDVAALGRR